MTGPLRVAAAVCRGSALGSAAALGVLGGQTWLARNRIPSSIAPPPRTHGTVWCARHAVRSRPPLHLALLGDSLAAGFGADEPHETVAAALAVRLSAATRRPVRISNHAAIGARSRDLRAQLADLSGAPDLTVIVVGSNDVTHHLRVSESVRHLSFVAHRLRLMGSALVVGTVPDLGTVKPIAEPLRSLAQRMGRVLASAQADVVRRAGGVPVPMDQLLGERFAADPTLFSADRFHPSGAGYLLAAEAMFPAAMSAVLARGTLAPIHVVA